MKNFKYNNILIISIIILSGFLSCVNEIKFTESQMAPLLVVNSLITPDSIIKLNLSLSRFFLNSDPNYTIVKNYEVQLWVNDVLKEKMVNKNGTYVSIYKPKIGNIIKIIAINPENQKLTSSQTHIQKRISILSVDSVMAFESASHLTINNKEKTGIDKIDTLGLVSIFKLNFRLNFNDSLNYKNYYRVMATLYQFYADGKTTNERLKLKPNDIVFEKINESEIFDNNNDRLFNIFNDNSFDGKNFGIKTFLYLKNINLRPEAISLYKSAGYRIPIKTEIVFNLQNITPEYFKYLKSIKDNNTDLQYLSEPVQVYNNVIGGIGILGSYTHSFFKMPILVDSKSFYYQ